MSTSITITGIAELEKAFDDLVKKYPDKAGETLQKETKLFRRKVIARIKQDTKSHMIRGKKTRKSISKASSYKVSGVQGYGSGQYVVLSTKSPHFHLVENGHDIVVPNTRPVFKNGQVVARVRNARAGQTIGHVEGTHSLEKTRVAFQNEMPDHIQRMVDEMIKGGGL